MDPTKRQRARIRELVSIAYGRELDRELGTLEPHFAEWRAGRLDPFELSDRIHRFHDGVSRELFKLYDGPADPRFAVANAVHRGILTRDEVADLLEALGGFWEFDPSQD